MKTVCSWTETVEKNLTLNGSTSLPVNEVASFQQRSPLGGQHIPILFPAAYEEKERRVRIRKGRISAPDGFTDPNR